MCTIFAVAVALLAAAATVGVAGMPARAMTDAASTRDAAVMFGYHGTGSIGTVVTFTLLTVLSLSVALLAMAMLLADARRGNDVGADVHHPGSATDARR